jgi:hypothetical protein
MPDIRKIRSKARRDLHQAMQVPAYYYENGIENGYRIVTVRFRNKPGQIGDIQGTGFNYAVMNETQTVARFLLDELTPIRNALLSVGPNDAYAINNVLQPNGITIDAEVTRLEAKEAADLSYPDPDA